MIEPQALAAAIQRDLLRTEAPKYQAPTCFACGRGMVARQNTGDDNIERFCSARCRNVYDAGFGVPDPQTAVPLSAWRIVAGPKGAIGTNPWQSIIDASEDKRKAAAGGEDLIRPRKLCQKCGARLPVWINGRAVPSNRKFCDACGTHKAPKAPFLGSRE